MDLDIFDRLSRLTNEELLSQLKRGVARERHATADTIAHLAEVEARELYLDEGFSSLFKYCTQALHLSENAAYHRMAAARAARRFPVILVLLERGETNLTTIKLLGPLLTPENHRALLDEARHQSCRDVEKIVARERPRPDVPASVRKLSEPRSAAAAAGSNGAADAGAGAGSCAGVAADAGTGTGADAGTGRGAAQGRGTAATSATSESAGNRAPMQGESPGLFADAGSSTAGSPRPAVVEPLSPGRYRVQFTASEEMHDKLRRAQELLRHRIPCGDVAAVFDQALDALLKAVEKQKFGKAKRARTSRGQTRGSRNIPAAVRQAVWERDGELCTFIAGNGQRCTERGFIQFDHRRPHAAGGPPTVDNLRILCRAHNRHAAKQYFGPPEDPRVHESVASYGLAAERHSGPLNVPRVREAFASYGVAAEADVGPSEASRARASGASDGLWKHAVLSG